MSRAPTTAVPFVDQGRHDGWKALLTDLRPFSGRASGTLRLVVLVMICVTVSEVFRIPEPATSAYVILFISRSESVSTVKTALVAGLAVVAAVFVTIVVFMMSLSDPALRVPLIALTTFTAIFCSRISPLGPAFFAAGFIIAYGLTAGDAVLGISLQSTVVDNTTTAGLPRILFVPPEEALLQFALWLAVVVAMPVALVVVGNLLAGRRPAQLLRTELVARLDACGRFCTGMPEAEHALADLAREGTARLDALVRMLGKGHRSLDYASLVASSQQMALTLLAWRRIATPVNRNAVLRPYAEAMHAAGRYLQHGSGTPPIFPTAGPVEPAARPLAAELKRAATAIISVLSTNLAARPALKPEAASPLISAAAARDPATLRFAVKVTLAVMLSYAAESLLDWPQIHTCVVTCFFVALGSVGESMHKATLRIAGALIGGSLGILTILLLMPVMTDLGHLLLAIALVTALAGWIANDSDRFSYAGWQIAIAYYLTVLQGYGPTLDMQTARDRVIGVTLGILIVLTVFSTCWPVSANQLARRQIALALGRVAALLRLAAPGARQIIQSLQTEYGVAASAARTLEAYGSFEPAWFRHDARRPIAADAIAQLDHVALLVSVVSNLQADADWELAPAEERQAVLAYHAALATWCDRCASWVATGTGGPLFAVQIPRAPPIKSAASASWHAALDVDLRIAMQEIMRASVANAGHGDHDV